MLLAHSAKQPGSVWDAGGQVMVARQAAAGVPFKAMVLPSCLATWFLALRLLFALNLALLLAPLLFLLKTPLFTLPVNGDGVSIQNQSFRNQSWLAIDSAGLGDY